MTEKPDGNKAKPTLSQQAVDLVMLGMKRAEVARRLGVRNQMVTLACQRAGIPNCRSVKLSNAGRQIRSKAAAAAATLYRESHGIPDPRSLAIEREGGASYREIARRHGLTIRQVDGMICRVRAGGYRHA